MELGLCYVTCMPLTRKGLFFFMKLLVMGNREGQVILAGDFNQVMDGMIGKIKPTGNFLPRYRAAIQSLVDVWRLVNPCEREYTFYSVP